MSDDSQRGYLFGILQRGAGPVGRVNRGRRLLSGQGAPGKPGSVHNGSAPAGLDRLSESSAAAGVDGSAQGLKQTKQLVHPQPIQSELRSTIQAADVAPDKTIASGALSGSFSQRDSKPMDSSSHHVNISSPDTFIEASPASEIDGNTLSLKQTQHVAPPQPTESKRPSATHAADAAQEKTIARGALSGGVSQHDSKAIDSSSQGVKLSSLDAVVESSPAVEIYGSKVSLKQLKQVAQRQSMPSGARSTTHAANASPEKPTATSTRPLESGSQPVDSSFQPPKPSAAEVAVDRSRIDLLPIAGARSSEARLPRLTVIEQGGQAISSDNSSPDTKQRRSVVIKANGDVSELQGFADPRTDDRGRPSPGLPSSQAPAIRSHAQLDLTPPQENRSRSREMSAGRDVQLQDKATSLNSLQADRSESIKAVRSLPREVPLVEHLRLPGSAASRGSAEQESGQTVFAHEETQQTPVASFHAGPSDSIAEKTKLTLDPTQPGRMGESLVWRGSPLAQSEEQFSGRRSIPPQQRTEPKPKLTINRLDVQIVNQPSPPTVPMPTAQPPAALDLRADTWENLERHQLAHLHLIL